MDRTLIDISQDIIRLNDLLDELEGDIAKEEAEMSPSSNTECWSTAEYTGSMRGSKGACTGAGGSMSGRSGCCPKALPQGTVLDRILKALPIPDQRYETCSGRRQF